jgi:hypothetical protein
LGKRVSDFFQTGVRKYRPLYPRVFFVRMAMIGLILKRVRENAREDGRSLREGGEGPGRRFWQRCEKKEVGVEGGAKDVKRKCFGGQEGRGEALETEFHGE